MIVRQARPDDAGAMTAIVNEIIAIGGTTADNCSAVALRYLE